MIYEEKSFESIKYLVRYPDNYTAGKKYPVIILFHGAGGRGNDINNVRTNPYFGITDNHKDFPFISVAPLCSTNTWFDMWETLKRLVVKIYNSPFTDKKRLYAMGPSMGGYATWQMGMSLPELFAAIVPICGGGMYWNTGRLKNVAVWAFHGAKDGTVLPEESEKMVNGVLANGGNAKLTLYPEADHNAWTPTYSDIGVFNWLLEHQNENILELTDKYTDSLIYG